MEAKWSTALVALLTVAVLLELGLSAYHALSHMLAPLATALQ